MAFGLAALYSQGFHKAESQFPKQLINAVIGLVPFSLFAFVKPRFWQRIMPVVYGLNVLMLLVVLSKMGHKLLGAQRWIQLGPIQFQPSEIAKLLLVLTLASYYASRQDRIGKLSTFAISFLHVSVPIGLVFLQPHLGAVMVMGVIWLSVSIAANVPMKFLVGAIVVLGLSATIVLKFPAALNMVLHPYQTLRVKSMNNHDIKNGNYQTYRASIAFAVGGVNGAGFLKGEQKEGGYIPEQDNDFIFSVVGEEGGLVGCSLALAAFAFFFFRIWLVMLEATEPYYRMIAAGILGLVAFHTVVNIAMVLGLIPVVGLWLPFFSAGGTALWLCMACVGLLLNIRSRERPVLFS
jgi:rod shape determining protein RodA